MPIQVSLSTVHKEIYKNALTLTTQKPPLGLSLSLSHTHIGLPWGFNLNFPMSIPFTFIWEYPNPSPPSQRLCHSGCPVRSVNIDNNMLSYALQLPVQQNTLQALYQTFPAYLIRQNQTKIQSNPIDHKSFNWVQ